MRRLSAFILFGFLAIWFSAATFWNPAVWLRWPVVLAGFGVLVVAAFARPAAVVPPTVRVPLALVVAYAIAISPFARTPILALAKPCMYFAVVWVALVGGAAVVESFGRDGFFRGWRIVWRAFLVVSVVGIPLGFWDQDSGGLYGPTSNPNMFAYLLASIGLILFRPREWESRTALAGVEAAVGCALLLLTRCRAALAAVVIGAVLCYGFHRRGRRGQAVVVALLLLVASALLLAPDASVHELQATVEGSTVHEMLETRAPAWSESLDAMLEGLPIGFGWGMKAHPSRSWNGEWFASPFGREEGTSWLPIGEELGLVGMALFLWCWVALAYSALTSPPSLRPLAVGGMGTWFVLASFEGFFLSPGGWETAALWTFAGAVLARPARDVIPATDGLPLRPALEPA